MAKLAPTQIEQLQSIGAYLRQVRQDQGASLDVLANQIFIRPTLLRAVEEGHDAELPEPVFIQGFIRRYAEALGLDGQAIAQEFRVTPVDVLPTPETLATANGNGVVDPQTRHSIRVLDQPSRPSPGHRSQRSPLPLALILATLAAVLGLGTWALWGRQGESPRANTDGETVVSSTDLAEADADAAAVPEADAPEADAPEADAPEAASTPAPLEAPVVVSATLSDRAWLSVVADGTNVYEGIAESGFEETWTAQSSLVFRTGNAGGVSLSINGDRPVAIGDSGIVRTLTLTPDSGAENIQTP